MFKQDDLLACTELTFGVESACLWWSDQCGVWTHLYVDTVLV